MTSPRFIKKIVTQITWKNLCKRQQMHVAWFRKETSRPSKEIAKKKKICDQIKHRRGSFQMRIINYSKQKPSENQTFKNTWKKRPCLHIKRIQPFLSFLHFHLAWRLIQTTDMKNKYKKIDWSQSMKTLPFLKADLFLSPFDVQKPCQKKCNK